MKSKLERIDIMFSFFDIATQGSEKMICLGSLSLRWRFCQTNILFQ
ncbi:MAG: hypothetical protein R2798_10970 [Chitinophagales bacterium]|nr:hypothetical protein [Bacteroidota bacterium]